MESMRRYLFPKRRSLPGARELASALILLLFSGSGAAAQNPQTRVNANGKFPYSFTNFVWWSDSQLRSLLKARIPNLPDQIGMQSRAQEQIRLALVGLLKEKGIDAHVQVLELSPVMSSLPRVPEAPPISIAFSVLAPPKILIDKLNLDGLPVNDSSLVELARTEQGRPYDANALWSPKMQIEQNLKAEGYLDATTTLQAGEPVKANESYRVPIDAVIRSGPVYHVSSVTVDGGPLLDGRDLSPYVGLKAGDLASDRGFARLSGALRTVYWQQGYEDVSFSSNPSLDHQKALVSYKFEVDPGPQYRLRNLAIKNLSPAEETEARRIVGMNSGDVYNGLAVARLNQNLVGSLAGYDLSYTPAKDKDLKVIDLTLTFFKK